MEKLNSSKTLSESRIIRYSNISLVLLSLSILGHFITFFQTKYNLISPIIPQYIICEAYEPFALGGLLISIGLFISVIFRIYKKLQLALINDMVWYFVASLTPYILY